MMYGEHAQGKQARDYDDNSYYRIKKLMCVANIVLLILSMIMLGGAIYILVEKTFISDIMENELLTAGVWLCIIGGSLLVLSIAFCGFVGAAMEKKDILSCFIVFLSLFFLVFLAGASCVAVMHRQIGDWIVVKMETSLKEAYGVDLDNKYNQFITHQWDKAQRDMHCCGGKDNSWALYRQSAWYAQQPPAWGYSLRGDPDKPYVPESCCRLDSSGTYVNLYKCQHFTDGPPFKRSGNFSNNALYGNGCFTEGMNWMRYNGAWIIGFGAGFAALLIFHMLFAVLLLLRLRK